LRSRESTCSATCYRRAITHNDSSRIAKCHAEQHGNDHAHADTDIERNEHGHANSKPHAKRNLSAARHSDSHFHTEQYAERHQQADANAYTRRDHNAESHKHGDPGSAECNGQPHPAAQTVPYRHGNHRSGAHSDADAWKPVGQRTR